MPPAAAKRARTSHAKDVRRTELLDAALAEFFESGFSAARMTDIASRAGVSKGTLYLYFDSKEALFRALIETFAIPNIEMLEAAAAQFGGGLGALKMIIRMAPTIVRESPVPKIAKVLVADSTNFPEIVSEYRQTVVERMLGMMAGLLARAHDAGEIEIGDPALTARIVVAPIFFSAMWRVVFEQDGKSKVDLDALFALYEDMLMRALRAKGETA